MNSPPARATSCRDGAFYDYEADPEEQKKLALRDAPRAAAAAHQQLQAVLDDFGAARPAHLNQEGGKKKALKGKKRAEGVY